MSGYTDRHEEQHGDREGASTKYVEVCWKCAADWIEYVRTHPYCGDERHVVVLAMRPDTSKP